MNAVLTSFYYQIKPMVPRWLQIELRRTAVKLKRKKVSTHWPILPVAAVKPEPWHGWPHQKRFALVLTHDVDTSAGQKNCSVLMETEKQLGFRSSFNFVPRKYLVSKSLLLKLKSNGFEIGVHGLYHDGKLFKSKSIFKDRARQINYYLDLWRAVGFRAPAMQHNLAWINELNIEYDMSTFDTDPFEPQPDGVNTIFPFWVGAANNEKGYIELPYTLPQDFTLYVLMKEKNSNIWRRKLEWIAENQGMVLLNTHPDYMSFADRKSKPRESYPASLYEEFLAWIHEYYHDQYWNALPRELARFWAKRYS